jgi:hypothetical protein
MVQLNAKKNWSATGQAQGLITVIPATWVVEIERIIVRPQSGQKSYQDPT